MDELVSLVLTRWKVTLTTLLNVKYFLLTHHDEVVDGQVQVLLFTRRDKADDGQVPVLLLAHHDREDDD